MCVRTSLLLSNDASNTVYNFNEQKVRVTINLANGFEVDGIDVNREAADENTPNAGTEYGLTTLVSGTRLGMLVVIRRLSKELP